MISIASIEYICKTFMSLKFSFHCCSSVFTPNMYTKACVWLHLLAYSIHFAEILTVDVKFSTLILCS